jgi:hypothetical protein
MSRRLPERYSDEAEVAAALVAAALGRRAAGARAVFLRELIRHAAAGLALLEGDRAASEACHHIALMAAACAASPRH